MALFLISVNVIVKWLLIVLYSFGFILDLVLLLAITQLLVKQRAAVKLLLWQNRIYLYCNNNVCEAAGTLPEKQCLDLVRLCQVLKASCLLVDKLDTSLVSCWNCWIKKTICCMMLLILFTVNCGTSIFKMFNTSSNIIFGIARMLNYYWKCKLQIYLIHQDWWCSHYMYEHPWFSYSQYFKTSWHYLEFLWSCAI